LKNAYLIIIIKFRTRHKTKISAEIIGNDS